MIYIIQKTNNDNDYIKIIRKIIGEKEIFSCIIFKKFNMRSIRIPIGFEFYSLVLFLVIAMFLNLIKYEKLMPSL
jgi:hypothetical protein